MLNNSAILFIASGCSGRVTSLEFSLPSLSLSLISSYLLVSRFTGVRHFNMVCINVHVLNIVVSLVNSSFPHGRGLDAKRPQSSLLHYPRKIKFIHLFLSLSLSLSLSRARARLEQFQSLTISATFNRLH